MRFNRCGRTEFIDTPRKRAALARKQQAERDALPLFAVSIAAEQSDADTVMARRAESWLNSQARMRERYAADWRRARTKLATYPEPARSALRAYWQRCGWPATGSYLLSMLHMFDTGRLDAVSCFLETGEFPFPAVRNVS